MEIFPFLFIFFENVQKRGKYSSGVFFSLFHTAKIKNWKSEGDVAEGNGNGNGDKENEV